MHIFMEIGPLKAYLKHQRSLQHSIGFTPTMGALHKGHASLIQASKSENSITVASIYVNPAQFNNPVDLEKYPRPFDKDVEMLKAIGCDALFCPTDSEMYDESTRLKFDFGALDKSLEGKFRQGHFSGVALVVAKLFNIVQPDRVYLGQKDFQQFKIISRLVKELKFELALVCAPIVREADGLALSSRNVRLDTEGRKRAVVLYQCLQHTREGLLQGRSFKELKKDAGDRCTQNSVKLEYLALADRENFTVLESVTELDRAILLIAGYVGEVRLIDNVFLVENKI